MNHHRRTIPSIPSAPALRTLAVLFSLALAPFLPAQGVVSSGLTGVVRDNGGKPVVGATLTATHVPTGTTYTAVSGETGRYYFRGLVVGGPFTLSAASSRMKTAEITEITTQLG